MNIITKITTCLGAIILLGSCGGNSNEIGDVELIPVKSGKDYQYIDKEGKIVINPQFSEASVFRNGLALVKSSGENPKWGFIDDKGTLAIPSNYVDATVFSEDLAWVVTENGAPTAINSKGEIKITLQDAETVNLFKEGLAAYSVSDSVGEKWGFVDKEGKVKKLVNACEEVTFSGRRGVAQGQDVTYVTERCVMRLTPEGVVVTEIAPGVLLQENIIDQSEFPLIISPKLKLMDAKLFAPEKLGGVVHG